MSLTLRPGGRIPVDDLTAAAEEHGFRSVRTNWSSASSPSAGARSVGSAVTPALAGYCLGRPHLIDLPFVVAGAVKIVYDLWLYRAFVSHEPGGEG
jgi:hypothetical protein